MYIYTENPDFPAQIISLFTSFPHLAPVGRLISPLFLNEINKILKKESIVFIATDSKSYLKQILENFLFNNSFFWLNKTVNDCYIKPNYLNKSKYEKKANLNKKKIFYLKFKKYDELSLSKD